MSTNTATITVTCPGFEPYVKSETVPDITLQLIAERGEDYATELIYKTLNVTAQEAIDAGKMPSDRNLEVYIVFGNREASITYTPDPAEEEPEEGNDGETPTWVTFATSDPGKERLYNTETGEDYLITVVTDRASAQVRLDEIHERLDELDEDPDQDPYGDEWNLLADEISSIKKRWLPEEADTPDPAEETLPTIEGLLTEGAERLNKIWAALGSVRDWLNSDWKPVSDVMTDEQADFRAQMMEAIAEARVVIEKGKTRRP